MKKLVVSLLVIIMTFMFCMPVVFGAKKSTRYQELYKYSRDEIKKFLVENGKNYGLSDDNERKALEIVWKAKLQNDNIAYNKSLYVDISDSFMTMKNYSYLEKMMYVTLYGPYLNNSGLTPSEMDEILKVWKSDGYSMNSFVLYRDYDSLIERIEKAKQEVKDGKADFAELWGSAAEEANGEIWGSAVKSGNDEDNENAFNSWVNKNEDEYTLPRKVSEGSETTNIDTIVSDANSFIRSSDKNEFSQESINDLSSTIYNVLLIVGVIIAVLVGAIIGIRFMIGSVEERADIKSLLIPYIVGCIVVFGAFGIWKIAVLILSEI